LSNGAGRRRIAGHGTTVQESEPVVKQYSQARKMMKSFSGGFLARNGKMKLPVSKGILKEYNADIRLARFGAKKSVLSA